MVTSRTRLLAWIYIILCGGCIAIGVVICTGLLLSLRDPRSGKALEMIGGFFVSASAVYFIPGFVGGLGLLRGHHWARITIITLSALGIFAFPVGTILGGFGLWVLLGSDSKQLTDGPQPPPPQPQTSKKSVSAAEKKRIAELLVVAAGIGAAFIVMIGTGYRITGDSGSPISNFSYYAAIGILSLVIVAIGWKIWRHVVGDSTPEERAALRDAHRQFVENRKLADQERREQLKRLTSDPVRRKYAELIRRGEKWSDEQIEYDVDVRRVATCPHLAPMEREMRAASIATRLLEPGKISARCWIDAESLRRFELPSFVEYAEPRPNTAFFDAPLPASIACGEHASSIDVVHPRDATSETPVFPPSAVHHAPTIGPAVDRFTELRDRIMPLARSIDVPSEILPTHRHSVGTGLPHIEIGVDSYSYVREDRGIESFRYSTSSVDELLYLVFRDITFSMGATEASDRRKPDEDYRRGAFKEQLALLGRLNTDWASRCAREHEEELTTRPFADR